MDKQKVENMKRKISSIENTVMFSILIKHSEWKMIKKKSEKIFAKIKAEILSGIMKNITQFKKPPQNSRYNIFFKSLHKNIMLELVKAAGERKAKFIQNSDSLTASFSLSRNTETTRKYSDMFDVLKINNCQLGKISFINEGEIKDTFTSTKTEFTTSIVGWISKGKMLLKIQGVGIKEYKIYG